MYIWRVKLWHGSPLNAEVYLLIGVYFFGLMSYFLGSVAFGWARLIVWMFDKSHQQLMCSYNPKDENMELEWVNVLNFVQFLSLCDKARAAFNQKLVKIMAGSPNESTMST